MKINRVWWIFGGGAWAICSYSLLCFSAPIWCHLWSMLLFAQSRRNPLWHAFAQITETLRKTGFVIHARLRSNISLLCGNIAWCEVPFLRVVAHNFKARGWNFVHEVETCQFCRACLCVYAFVPMIENRRFECFTILVFVVEKFEMLWCCYNAI